MFIVNASNRYTIAMTDIEPRNWNYYTMYIRSVIHGVMQEMGYSEDQIGQYFKMSGDTTVTKTHGKKAVGGINRMVMDAQYFDKKLEKETMYQWELSEYLNSRSSTISAKRRRASVSSQYSLNDSSLSMRPYL